ncbi:MAG TPA: ABC transporter substrate-binding protein, partial [Tepidisphaeraceae bacterium]
RDLNTMLLNFEQGITDVFSVPSGKEVARLKPKQEQGNYKLYQFGPDDGTLFVAFNMNLDAAKGGKIPLHKVEWFRDPRFRQAISHAIDREAQIRNVRRNLGYPQFAPYTLSPGPFKQEGFAPLPFAPATAKALLAEMGFKPGSDGKLHDAKGNKLTFTINTNSGNNIREETANFIRKDLESIGIEVNTLFLEFNLLVDKLDNAFDWECIIMGFTGGREPHFGANFWLSSANLHLWWPEQKQPSFPWEKRIDEIFKQGISELDPVKRKALYREWIEIVYREQPVIYLTVGERVSAMRDRFGNVFPSPIGGLLHNEEQLFVLTEK